MKLLFSSMQTQYSPGARGAEMIFYTARVLKRFDDDFNRLKSPL